MNVLTIFNSRRLAVCNCNCEHYRTKFYFGIWCQNKVIIIIIMSPKSSGALFTRINVPKSCNARVTILLGAFVVKMFSSPSL